MSHEEPHIRFKEAAKKYYLSKPASNTVKSNLIEFASYQVLQILEH